MIGQDNNVPNPLTGGNQTLKEEVVVEKVATTPVLPSQTADVRRMKFSTDMWDGFDVLCKRTEAGIDQCKELLDFFKKRAAMEDKYSKFVVEQFSKFKLKDETDSFQKGFSCLSVLSEAESNIHKSFSTNLSNNLIHPFNALVKEMETRRKNLVNEGQRLRNDFKDSLEAVRKASQKYEKLCKENEAAKIELITMLEKETDVEGPSVKVQAIEKKVAKCEANCITAEEEYKIQIKETNDFIQGYYQSKMTDNLNEFEQFELMRMQFIKSNIKNYMALMLELPPALDGELTSRGKQTDIIDPEEDLQSYIKNHASVKKIPPPFQFEPFVEGKLISLSSSTSGTGSVPMSTSPPAAKSSGGFNLFGFFGKSSSSSVPPPKQQELQSLKSRIFGADLEELMDQQKADNPQLEVPLILVDFVQTLLKLNAFETENIFRMSPSHAQTLVEKQKLDEGGSLDHLTDVHMVASLLKQWLKDLPNPLISFGIYDEIITTPHNSTSIIENGIPLLNQRVLKYLIDFLAEFLEPEFAESSKMDVQSLAVVLTPTLIRTNIDLDPQEALENSKKEVVVVKCLIMDALNKKKEKELMQAEKARSRSSSVNKDNNTNQSSSENISRGDNNNNNDNDNDDGDITQVPERSLSNQSFGTSEFSVNKSDSDTVLVDSESTDDFIQVTNDSLQHVSSNDEHSLHSSGEDHS
ncbi:hypothetical protein SAMD00019534_046460 [Acytostelium subglobosum LB1]|uniref:hypothetical protein n=1 Tax=Acytostelium subglobosum LB1 TaxID=1410327 RepID=UPI0006449579|nr:hypothetical protein SAMD00019534_046460 [Acytostelium subglobosum LB1]GAM21471.1 hypothetical protein SAMD00019534_046460 [Acytostelium subglobosum LB1]|eukprot:XP_012755590.1 hypothetical protein SAMD00019534_046460 [Acytostelium subglobosum LB1]